MNNAYYPNTRLRRSRLHTWSRELVSESHLQVSDLVLPLFIKDGKNEIEPIVSMPGVYRYSIDTVLTYLKSIDDLNIPLMKIGEL